MLSFSNYWIDSHDSKSKMWWLSSSVEVWHYLSLHIGPSLVIFYPLTNLHSCISACRPFAPHCISNFIKLLLPLRWRHNGRDSVSNHQPHDCLHNRLFRRRSKKTSKPCVTGLYAGNSPGTGEFPAQMACNAEHVSIWWRHPDNGTSKFTL